MLRWSGPEPAISPRAAYFYFLFLYFVLGFCFLVFQGHMFFASCCCCFNQKSNTCSNSIGNPQDNLVGSRPASVSSRLLGVPDLKAQAFPGGPQGHPSLTVPYRETLEGITLAATNGTNVPGEREPKRSLQHALPGPQFPLLYMYSPGPDGQERFC